MRRTLIIEVVPPLTFTQARETVVATVRAARPVPAAEEAGLENAAGRVLAEDIAADRDVPAAARSVRDGYAVRAADLPGDGVHADARPLLRRRGPVQARQHAVVRALHVQRHDLRRDLPGRR